MPWHLSYDKNGANKSALGSSRNGNTPKRIKGTHVEVEILTPRHCDVSFEPQLVRKHQTRRDGALWSAIELEVHSDRQIMYYPLGQFAYVV